MTRMQWRGVQILPVKIDNNKIDQIVKCNMPLIAVDLNLKVDFKVVPPPPIVRNNIW